MTTTRPLTNSLVVSGSKVDSRGEDFVNNLFGIHKVNNYCVYVDHTSREEDVPELSALSNNGYFTFDINKVGNIFKGDEIMLIRTDGDVPECDGWIVASTSRASAFSLAAALKNAGKEDQIICRLYDGQTTKIGGYMDLFSGETETLIYINHYFDRKYRINFPIDLRYSVCTCDGETVLSGQRIIPAGGITVLDTRDMALGKFKGYLQVDLEVENLQSRIQPFLHFWADYISDAGICRNHQSGWAPHPPGAVFNRGVFTLDDDLESIGSFYNENDTAAQATVLLHYNQNGVEEKYEKTLTPIPPRSMRYYNFSDLFSDVAPTKANSAYLLIKCDTPLHRPNHYIAKKNKEQFVDTYHQTRGAALYWEKLFTHDNDKIKRMKQFGVYAWIATFPILEQRFGIDTCLGLLSETVAGNGSFIFKFLDGGGEEIYCESEILNSQSKQFINLNEYADRKGIKINQGTFCLIPNEDELPIHVSPPLFFGLKHKQFKYISTSFREGEKEAKLPFYVDEGRPVIREYSYSPLQISDLFSPGFVSDEYDSIVIIEHKSLLKSYRDSIKYELEIVDSTGRRNVSHRKIAAFSHDAFWLSDILKEMRLPWGYYTVWIKSNEAYLKSFHGLYRKKDHALSFDDGSEGTLQKEPQI